MKHVITALFAVGLVFGAALAAHMFAFPSPVDAGGVEKPRPPASFLHVDEGLLSDLAALKPYAPTPAATGSEVGKGSVFSAPDKADYHF